MRSRKKPTQKSVLKSSTAAAPQSPPQNEPQHLDHQEQELPLQHHQTTASPLPPELAQPGGSDAPAIGAEHFSEIQDPAPESEDDAVAGEDAGDVETVAGPGGRAVLSRAAFHKNFRTMFKKGGAYLPALTITPDEDESASDAFDALYDTCLDVTWLRFLVAPESEWAGRALVIASFLIPKGIIGYAQIQIMRAQRPARPDNVPVAGGFAVVREQELPNGAEIRG